jgi:hypothetical protein
MKLLDGRAAKKKKPRLVGAFSLTLGGASRSRTGLHGFAGGWVPIQINEIYGLDTPKTGSKRKLPSESDSPLKKLTYDNPSAALWQRTLAIKA